MPTEIPPGLYAILAGLAAALTPIVAQAFTRWIQRGDREITWEIERRKELKAELNELKVELKEVRREHDDAIRQLKEQHGRELEAERAKRRELEDRVESLETENNRLKRERADWDGTERRQPGE